MLIKTKRKYFESQYLEQRPDILIKPMRDYNNQSYDKDCNSNHILLNCGKNSDVANRLIGNQICNLIFENRNLLSFFNTSDDLSAFINKTNLVLQNQVNQNDFHEFNVVFEEQLLKHYPEIKEHFKIDNDLNKIPIYQKTIKNYVFSLNENIINDSRAISYFNFKQAPQQLNKELKNLYYFKMFYIIYSLCSNNYKNMNDLSFRIPQMDFQEFKKYEEQLLIVLNQFLSNQDIGENLVGLFHLKNNDNLAAKINEFINDNREIFFNDSEKQNIFSLFDIFPLHNSNNSLNINIDGYLETMENDNAINNFMVLYEDYWEVTNRDCFLLLMCLLTSKISTYYQLNCLSEKELTVQSNSFKNLPLITSLSFSNIHNELLLLMNGDKTLIFNGNSNVHLAKDIVSTIKSLFFIGSLGFYDEILTVIGDNCTSALDNVLTHKERFFPNKRYYYRKLDLSDVNNITLSDIYKTPRFLIFYQKRTNNNLFIK